MRSRLPIESAVLVGLLCLLGMPQRGAGQPPERSREQEQLTKVVTVLGRTTHLERLRSPALEEEREKFTAAEWEQRRRQYYGRRVYESVWRGVLSDYVEREKLEITEPEMAGIIAAVDRRLATPSETILQIKMEPEKRRALMIAMARGSHMDWKVCKALHEKYGGRVGIGSLGAWTAFDGQNALIREYIEAGDIAFHLPEMEEAFWEHTKISNFADAYPKGERLERLLARPPYERIAPAPPSAPIPQ